MGNQPRSKAWVVAALVLLSPAAVARAQSALPRVERVALVVPGTIAGVVQDEKGVPIAGAVVSALGPTTATALTDRHGKFEIRPLSPGAYLVRAHSTGFVTPRGQLVEVRSSVRASSSIALRREPAASAPTYPVLAAGVGAPPDGRTEASIAPAEREDSSAEHHSEENHSEIAWRLRHARRGVLKEVTIAEALLHDGLPGTDAFGRTGRFGSVSDSSAGLARDFFSAPLSGQLNLLTTGSFDTPQQLFSGDSFSRGIAYLSLGAAARDADWTVRGALTQGDVASWIVAGTYASRSAAKHQYQAGLSYSTQRSQSGNLATLRDASDGSRNVGHLYGFDTLAVARGVSLTYGARVSRYDYLDKPGLLSPRLGLTVLPGDDLRITALASSAALAPGATEFVPPVESAIWLPPQRTFSSFDGRGLEAERTNHLELALERGVGGATLTARVFRQQVSEQIATVFGVDIPDTPARLGHYFVANTGGVQGTGWSAGLRTAPAKRVHGSMEYTVTNARWNPANDVGYLVVFAPSLLRLEAERVHDIAASLDAQVPETATRLVVLYRVSNAFSVTNERPGLDSRFDIQVRQSLPFMDFGAAKWEMLLAVRSLFSDAAADSSIYDELLVIHPPKRIVGGLTLRF